MVRNFALSAALLLVFLIGAPMLQAQQSSIDDLKKEIQSLSETVKAMQKDLQEIKALLSNAKAAPAAPSPRILLDTGNNPARGERTAKLTLIEFSDYQ
jgi:hypothetical protein